MLTDSVSVLCVSLTVNLCTLSFFGCGRALEYVGTKYGNRTNFLKVLVKLHERKPWLFGKTLTELAATCALIVLSVIALSTTSVSGLPFSGNQTAPLEPLVETVLSVNVGRYVYMCVQDGFLHLHLNHFKTDLIHHFVTIGAYIVFLAYKQNVYLGLAGLLMELNLVPMEIGRLVREVDRHCLLYRRIAIVSCVVTVTSRGILPIVFLAIALRQESPFTMRVAPLTVFFLCIVFFFVINFWMILQTVSRVVRYSPCGPGEVDENNLNYVTVRNPMEPQSRDVVLPGQGDRQSVTFSNLNYGYLKSYDNRNVCNNDNEKINLNTKNASKPNLSFKGTPFPATLFRSATDHVSHNHVDVVRNNFRKSRVRFQDEVDQSRVTPQPRMPKIESSVPERFELNSPVDTGHGRIVSSDRNSPASGFIPSQTIPLPVTISSRDLHVSSHNVSSLLETNEISSSQ